MVFNELTGICLETSNKWVQNIRGQKMNRSTFWMNKYMNGSVVSKARYMNGVRFEIPARTPVPKLPLSYHAEFQPNVNHHKTKTRDVMLSFLPVFGEKGLRKQYRPRSDTTERLDQFIPCLPIIQQSKAYPVKNGHVKNLEQLWSEFEYFGQDINHRLCHEVKISVIHGTVICLISQVSYRFLISDISPLVLFRR